MWIYNDQVIRTPKTMVVDGITYPRQIFRDTDTLTALGIIPYSEERINERYYWKGTKTVDENGHATFATTEKDVETLKEDMIRKVKNAVSVRLSQTDWMVIRASEGGTAVPSDVTTYRAGIRTEGNTKETEIDALTTIDEIIAYEEASFTEVRRVVVTTNNEDGTITESYHETDTISSNRTIDKCTYFTSVDPLAEVDAGLVSLTED